MKNKKLVDKYYIIPNWNLKPYEIAWFQPKAPEYINITISVIDYKIIKIGNDLYQIKSNNEFWKRNKEYPLIKLTSKLTKLER